MTDRHAGYIITLDRDVREDDAEAIVTALRMIKGVLSVAPVAADVALHMAKERAEYAVRERVYAALTQRSITRSSDNDPRRL